MPAGQRGLYFALSVVCGLFCLARGQTFLCLTHLPMQRYPSHSPDYLLRLQPLAVIRPMRLP